MWRYTIGNRWDKGLLYKLKNTVFYQKTTGTELTGFLFVLLKYHSSLDGRYKSVFLNSETTINGN